MRKRQSLAKNLENMNITPTEMRVFLDKVTEDISFYEFCLSEVNVTQEKIKQFTLNIVRLSIVKDNLIKLL